MIACTLDLSIEMEMIEAVFLASEGIDEIRLILRNHPDERASDHKDFQKMAQRIEVSDRTLEDDFELADLIIYTITTVAEEAFICGIPVWQWLPLNYNGSALSAVTYIPRFASVGALRTALKRAIINTEEFSSSEEKRVEVSERLFYRTDGNAAKRIAEQCVAEIPALPEEHFLANH